MTCPGAFFLWVHPQRICPGRLSYHLNRMKLTDQSLDELLKSSRVPARSEGYWERFPKRVSDRIREPLPEPTGDRARGLHWWLAVSTACLVLGLGVVMWKTASSSKPPGGAELARSERVFREIAALFPGRVQAVVVDGEDVKLALSDEANVPPSTPLYVKICGAAKCRNIITFSGQRIQVNGETLDVLSDAKGNVIVTGRHFAWTSATPTQGAGSYRIEAHRLGARS